MSDQSLGEELREEHLTGVLDCFYARLAGDDLLASFFRDLDMAEHIPRIEAFWATVVFGNRRYVGNAFAPHQRLHGLTPAHFARWVATLEAVLDERFEGPSAELMKASAHRIAYSMQLRLGITPFATYRPDAYG